GGMSTSFTSESTILPKAAPMITPTARSKALPFIANSLNSLSMAPPGRGRWRTSAAERGLHLLQGVDVLLERVEMGLDVADRRAELGGGAEHAALLAGLVHQPFADVAELGLRGSLAERAAEPSGREDRDHSADSHSLAVRHPSHGVTSSVDLGPRVA